MKGEEEIGPARIEGFYTGHPKGFGFVRPRGLAQGDRKLRAHDLFIPRGAAGGAIDGDRVLIETDGRSAGKVLEVLARGRTRLAGTVLDDGTFRPDAHAIPHALTFREGPGAAPRPGDKVVAVADGLEFRLAEILGRSGDRDVEDYAVLEEVEVAGPFPAEAEREAARFAGARVGPKDRRGRVDLRDEPAIVTIDPMTAKDFDDAISLRGAPGGGYVLGVHIADVGHYVEEGTTLDREARRRGQSAYLPMRVVPMLPAALSDGLASLHEGEDRLALSVLLTYDRRGTLKDARAARTAIRSVRRFTYERASRLMEGAGGETADIARLLKDMHALARHLRSRRPSLAIHEPGVEFVYSPTGDIVEVATTEGDDAHWVIEEFMLAANRAVAGWLFSIREPVLFRHHPPPGDLGELRSFLHEMGVSGARDRPLAELMRRAQEAGHGPAATSFLMEAMEAAVYSPLLPHHDALAFPHYCHFTSPIRRYADLVVHRAVARHLRAGKWVSLAPPRRGAALSGPASTPELEELGAHLSRRERAVAHAEARLRRRRILEYLGTRTGTDLHGVLMRVLDRGLLVNLPGYLISGFLALDALGAGPRKTAPHALTVGGKVFRPGHPLTVRVARVNPLRGELDLTLPS